MTGGESLAEFRAAVVAAKKVSGSQCGVCNLPPDVLAKVDALLRAGGAASDCSAIARVLDARKIRDHKGRIVQDQTIARHRRHAK